MSLEIFPQIFKVKKKQKNFCIDKDLDHNYEIALKTRQGFKSYPLTTTKFLNFVTCLAGSALFHVKEMKILKSQNMATYTLILRAIFNLNNNRIFGP